MSNKYCYDSIKEDCWAIYEKTGDSVHVITEIADGYWLVEDDYNNGDLYIVRSHELSEPHIWGRF